MRRLTQKHLNELLSYNKRTGRLTWKTRPGNAWFNARFAGKPALATPDGKYLVGSIYDKKYLAHRVIFKMVTGRWPSPQIDHRNRKGRDNRWQNLREADRKLNQMNKGLDSRNRTGHRGVCRVKRVRAVRYQVSYGRKTIGTFSSIRAAVSARKRAEG